MQRASYEVMDPETGLVTRQLCGIEAYVDVDGVERYNLLAVDDIKSMVNEDGKRACGCSAVAPVTLILPCVCLCVREGYVEVEGVDTKTLETDSDDSENENEVRRSMNPPERLRSQRPLFYCVRARRLSTVLSLRVWCLLLPLLPCWDCGQFCPILGLRCTTVLQ